MRNKYVFVLVMLLCIGLISAGLTLVYRASGIDETLADEGQVTIVTSFYPMYIATANIADGIDGIEIKNLSEPQTGCLHDFQLTPEDMKLLSKADVFVINGGGIEAFMDDVMLAYPELSVVEACSGLELIDEDGEHDHEDEDGDDDEHDNGHEDGDADEHHEHSHGDSNAHAWMSLAYYRMQVENITNQLAKADPAHAASYRANADAYDKKLQALEQEQQKVAQLSAESNQSNIVIFHEAFEYVAKDYGMNICGVMDLDEERQISAGEVADIIKAIEENDVAFVLAEELYGADMGRTIEKETNAKVIYIDPLNRGDYRLDSYIDGMQANIDKLCQAFSGKES